VLLLRSYKTANTEHNFPQENVGDQHVYGPKEPLVHEGHETPKDGGCMYIKGRTEILKLRWHE